MSQYLRTHHNFYLSYIRGFNYSQQGTLTIPEVCQDLLFSSEDLFDEGEIGRGAYGFVNRMVHAPTGFVMAVKRIRSTLNEREQKNTLKDLDVVMNSANCRHIVQFFGALFKEGDCWICMEMMDTSLDKFYRFVYRHMCSRIPEPVLGKITVAMVSALDYLKTELKVIHRDVKPSNILIDRKGNIKLCDFGISGQLVDSIARSRDAGCKPYMAPERIHPKWSVNGYDIRSDVWSLGISLVELATGRFPYPAWSSVFQQLACVLSDPAPTLPLRLSLLPPPSSPTPAPSISAALADPWARSADYSATSGSMQSLPTSPSTATLIDAASPIGVVAPAPMSNLDQLNTGTITCSREYPIVSVLNELCDQATSADQLVLRQRKAVPLAVKIEGSSEDDFSPEFRDFVSHCLEKRVRDRPKYHVLKRLGQ
ncbi:unnamed protein product [Protopolystoma xenopodis]|uniref:mitogen-activated protein kinase kinase n=1 Tax=Protopolystoma xenopodis TaxID=117903 RepID=A0A448XFB1_9PLAT|nr:unnamed protein product [Protopolystoma xenopodis]